MTRLTNRNLFKRVCVFAGLLFFVGFNFQITGCASFSLTKRGAKKISRSYNKKVAITLFENNIFTSVNDFEKTFQKSLADSIRQTCPDILFVMTGDNGWPDKLDAPDKFSTGQIDNIKLALTGRQIGLNAIITGIFADITGEKKRRFLGWLKKNKFIIRVRVEVEAYDPETGTKIIDKSFVNRVKVNEAEFDYVKAKDEKGLNIITKALNDLIPDISDQIGDILKIQSWKGFVVAVASDSRVVISSGSQSGLIAGDILEVFDTGNSISGIGGHRFFIPGLKTGEIKITSVNPKSAEAKIVSGSDIKPGSTVRLKK